MDKILNENLFLLEFLIDEVNLHPGAVASELEYAIGETCITIKFLNNDPLEICESDFSPKCCNMESNMKNGKSCLFAISPKQVDEVMKKFDLDVKIFKKLTYGVQPNKVQVGTTKIPLETLFNEILEEVKDKADGQTVSKTLKDIYPIVPPQLIDKCCIGDIAVFVRMSCFGKLIVTQFQMNLQEKSVFFKDKEGKSVYKYKKTCHSGGGPDCMACCPGADACMTDNCCYVGCNPPAFYPSCPANPPSCCAPPSCPLVPSCCPSSVPCPPQPSCGGCGSPPGCGPPPGCAPPPSCCGPPACFPPPPSCMFPPCGFPPCAPSCPPDPCTAVVPCCPSMPPPPDKSCYQEIGAEMNGNALTIRVHKNKGFSVKRIDETGKEVPMIGDCPCDQPQSKGLPSCGCSGGATVQSYPDPCSCMGGRSPSPCMNQAVSMRQGDDPTNPFTFKVTGCGTQANRNVTIIPPISTKTNDSVPTNITDYNKDVFVLRIGKKSEGTDKKANLELELVTPKGKDKKPIPRKETRETQFVESDLPEKTKGPGKGKGKGKGKKGKKGKKTSSAKGERQAAFQDQKSLELAHGISRGKDGKIIVPPGSPPARGPDGSLIPGGAIIRGPDGKILRIISASGTVRGPDGKIISFSVPVKKPCGKGNALVDTSGMRQICFYRTCCPMRSSCAARSMSCCSARLC